jgi:hypothetical protein
MTAEFLIAVRDRLGGLIQVLQADGYDLEIDGDADVLDVRITAASSDACADCLVPEDTFRSMVASELGKAGLTPGLIRPQYPTAHE